MNGEEVPQGINPFTRIKSQKKLMNGAETPREISLKPNLLINLFIIKPHCNGAEIRPETNPKYSPSNNGLQKRPKTIRQINI